jgi:hypothetical protein
VYIQKKLKLARLERQILIFNEKITAIEKRR